MKGSGGSLDWAHERARFIEEQILPRMGSAQRHIIKSNPSLLRKVEAIVDEAAGG